MRPAAPYRPLVIEGTKKGNRLKPIPLNTSMGRILALGKLKAGSGAFLPVFFSFLDPGVPLDEAGPLQRSSEVGIDEDESPGDAVPNSPGLTRNTAPDNPDHDII